jgi:hypothetical protein
VLFKYGAYRTCAVALARSRIDREKARVASLCVSSRNVATYRFGFLPVTHGNGGKTRGTPVTEFVGRGFGRRADVRAVRWWVWMVATCEVRLCAPVCP